MSKKIPVTGADGLEGKPVRAFIPRLAEKKT